MAMCKNDKGGEDLLDFHAGTESGSNMVAPFEMISFWQKSPSCLPADVVLYVTLEQPVLVLEKLWPPPSFW